MSNNIESSNKLKSKTVLFPKIQNQQFEEHSNNYYNDMQKYFQN